MKKYIGRLGRTMRPLGSFHAASQNSFLLKIVQEPLKVTFGLTLLGLNLFLCSRKYCRDEAVLCNSALVIQEDSKSFPPMFCEQMIQRICQR